MHDVVRDSLAAARPWVKTEPKVKWASFESSIDADHNGANLSLISHSYLTQNMSVTFLPKIGQTTIIILLYS